MASGIGITDECKTAFNSLLKDSEYTAVVMKVSDDLTEVVVESKVTPYDGPAADGYKKFVETLPEADCRFVIYDFEYVYQDIKKNRVVLITWSPEDAKIKSKMMYASSKQALQQALDGIQIQVQATDMDEISYDAVLKGVISNSVSY